jgi:ABC-type bacteriocin/lantibiotic exporter with double-glycine peptidase domain
MEQKIELNKMIYKSLLDNKLLIVSLLTVLGGHWIQDVIFSRKFSKILTDIPEYSKNINFSGILSLIFPYLFANFLFYINDIIDGNTFPKIEMDIIHKLMDKVLESIKTTKKNVNINVLILNLKNIMEIKNIYGLITIYILPTMVIGTALIYYFLRADLKMGLLIISLMALFILTSVKMENNCVKITNDYESEIVKFYDELQDLMNNNDTILSSNTVNTELKNIQNTQNKCVKKHIYSEIKSGEVSFGLSSISMFFMMIIDGIAIKLYNDNKIEPDMLISICMMSYTFINYYNSSIYKVKNVMHYISKYKELIKYFNDFTIKNDNNNNDIDIGKCDIIFKNVKVIHDDKIMPNVLNFKINGGSKVGIIGEIGKGKTSILKILAGLKKYIGDVIINNQNIKNCSYKSLTDNIIYISQHPKLFNRTIWENLAYGTTQNAVDIKLFIKIHKLENFFKKFPQGIYTNVGKEGNKLSGGQKQIIALIRCIIHQKSLILLDEPTSSLDAETKKIFIKLIESITDKTIITVTHDKTIHHLFDKIIEL